jgi:hypothetical protein
MCAGGKKKGTGNVRPTELFNELIKQSPRYKGYHQHDAHELLWTFLDLLRMEESRRLLALSQRATTAAAAGDGAGAAGDDGAGDVARTAEPRTEGEEGSGKRKRVKPPPTLVDLTFGGQCRTFVKCKRCSHESVIYEDMAGLSLPVVQPTEAAAEEEELSKRERKKQETAARAGKQQQQRERAKVGGTEAKRKEAGAEEEVAGREEEDEKDAGKGKKAGKDKKKILSKHEKRVEMARIKAEKIAAARSKRRGGPHKGLNDSHTSDSSSSSSPGRGKKEATELKLATALTKPTRRLAHL